MLYKRLIINGKEYLLAVSQAGSGAPAAATPGSEGILYMDTDTEDLYKCTGGEDGAWAWKKLSEGGSDYKLPIGGENLGGVKNGGNVVINEDGTMDAPVSNSSQNIELDTTLTQSGKAADAKAVGDALTELEQKIPENGEGGVSDYTELTNKPKINGVEVSGNKTSADYGIGNPTNEQVTTAVQTYLDEHPEATTTVADGSITGAKLADGVMPLEEECTYSLTADAHAHISLDLTPISDRAGKTANIEFYYQVLSDEIPIFRYYAATGDYYNAVNDYVITGHTVENINESDKVYRVTANYTIKNGEYTRLNVYPRFTVSAESQTIKIFGATVTIDGVKLKWVETNPNCMISFGVTSTLYKEISALDANILQAAKDYANESLANYVYEIPDKNITIDKLSDEVFEIDRECVYSGFSDGHTIASLDLTPISDRAGKTANIEFYYQVLNETAPGFKFYAASGKSRDDRDDFGMSGSRSAVDEESKIYKVTGTYTIKNGEYTRLNVYPRFQLSEGTNEIKVYGVNVTIDGEKLNWVEASVPYGELLPITIVVPDGVTVAKLEHTKQLISEAIGAVEDAVQSAEASVNDTKGEIAQLKALIGNGMNTIVESPLNGKKWGVVGDSITFGTGATDATTTYHGYISTKYLTTISNMGYPGKCIALRPEYNDTLIDQLKSTPEDCDYVTVFAGTNDFGFSIDIGTFDDATNETFYGAVKNMCRAMYERFGAKKFAFMTPTQRSDGNRPNNAEKTLKDYRDVIIEVCAYYGIPVLDLYAESGINPGLYSGFTGDGMHLNDAGHERISNRIAKFLESL